jgi:hypothetical protein
MVSLPKRHRLSAEAVVTSSCLARLYLSRQRGCNCCCGDEKRGCDRKKEVGKEKAKRQRLNEREREREREREERKEARGRVGERDPEGKKPRERGREERRGEKGEEDKING